MPENPRWYEFRRRIKWHIYNYVFQKMVDWYCGKIIDQELVNSFYTHGIDWEVEKWRVEQEKGVKAQKLKENN